MERDFKGVWIPAEIYLAPELSWTEKILVTEIFSFQKSEEGCFASNEYFAEFLGVSVKTVANAITRLSEMEIVTVEGYGKQRKLFVSLSRNRETSPKVSRKQETTFPKSGNSIYRNINTEINTVNNISLETKRNQKGSRLPSDWTVSDDLLGWFLERDLNVDFIIETEKFKNYFWAAPGQKGVKLDWDATWRNWMLNAEKYGKSKKPTATNREKLGEYEALFDKYSD